MRTKIWMYQHKWRWQRSLWRAQWLILMFLGFWSLAAVHFPAATQVGALLTSWHPLQWMCVPATKTCICGSVCTKVKAKTEDDDVAVTGFHSLVLIYHMSFYLFSITPLSLLLISVSYHQQHFLNTVNMWGAVFLIIHIYLLPSVCIPIM